MENEILDAQLEFELQQDGKYFKAFKWWEKRRLYFNLFVGIGGLLPMLMNWQRVMFFDIFGVAMWGIVANIFYSTGFVLEVADYYYFNGKVKIIRLRYLIFVLGTAFYAFISFVYCWIYYNPWLL